MNDTLPCLICMEVKRSLKVKNSTCNKWLVDCLRMQTWSKSYTSTYEDGEMKTYSHTFIQYTYNMHIWSCVFRSLFSSATPGLRFCNLTHEASTNHPCGTVSEDDNNGNKVSKGGSRQQASTRGDEGFYAILC